jgi:hypothetical protein
MQSQSGPGPKPRPAYLDATPAAVRRDTPVPRKRASATPVPVDDDRPSRAPLFIGIALVGALGLGVVLIALVIGIAVFGRGGDDDAREQAQTEQLVPVRNNMTQKPALIGTPVGEPPPAETAPLATAEPAPAAGAPIAPAPAPAAPAAPQPTPAVAAPAPAPRAAPRPAPAAVQPATKGVLKIRSNRRVLVYIDGQASGYTPLEMKVDPGAHTVVAMVPGQPNTKQERSASVAAGGDTVAVDFAF